MLLAMQRLDSVYCRASRSMAVMATHSKTLVSTNIRITILIHTFPVKWL
jgi:hypothetical protein